MARWFDLDNELVFDDFLMKPTPSMKAAWSKFRLTASYERKRKFADLLFNSGALRQDAWLARGIVRELARNGSYEDLFDAFLVMNDFAVTKKDHALLQRAARMTLKIGTMEQVAVIALIGPEPYARRANRRLTQQGATWDNLYNGVLHYLCEVDRDLDDFEEALQRIFF